MSAKRCMTLHVVAGIVLAAPCIGAAQNLTIAGTTTGNGSAFLATSPGSNVGVGTATLL